MVYNHAIPSKSFDGYLGYILAFLTKESSDRKRRS